MIAWYTGLYAVPMPTESELPEMGTVKRYFYAGYFDNKGIGFHHRSIDEAGAAGHMEHDDVLHGARNRVVVSAVGTYSPPRASATRNNLIRFARENTLTVVRLAVDADTSWVELLSASSSISHASTIDTAGIDAALATVDLDDADAFDACGSYDADAFDREIIAERAVVAAAVADDRVRGANGRFLKRGANG